jgi:periplasmic protein TonB
MFNIINKMKMIKIVKTKCETFMRLILAFSFVTVLLLTISTKVNAQSGDDKILFVAEEMPSFPGGDKALQVSLYKNLRYPEEAYNNNIEGKVLIRFVITKDGTVTDATVLRSADPALDKAALDAVKKLPKFNPGKQKGNPVNVWYTLPIVFNIK